MRMYLYVRKKGSVCAFVGVQVCARVRHLSIWCVFLCARTRAFVYVCVCAGVTDQT